MSQNNMGHGASVRHSSSHSDTSRWKDFSQPASQDTLQFWSGRYGMTMEEVRVAWNRFRLLNPDEYGLVSRDVFRRPPYSNNMFCKQIWARIPGSDEDRDSIPFEAFLETLKWWQYASVEKKVDLLLGWMCKDQSVKEDLLEKIFRHAKDELAQEEVKQLARDSVRYMKETRPPDSTEQPANVSLEDFKRYILQFPRNELETALHFSVLDIDTHEPVT